MKLAIIRRRYNPHGGAERFIERILPKLTERGIEPTIIAEQWDSEGSRIPVLKIKTRGLSRTGKFRSFQNAVQKVISDNKLTTHFDLVQSHERTTNTNIFRLGDGVHAAWISRLQQESSTLRSIRLRLDPYHRCVMEIEREMARDSNLQYVANSPLVESELQQYLSVPADRITVIPNGVDTHFFHPVQDAEKLKLRQKLANTAGIELNRNTLLVSFVGSGFERKGAFPLIKACASLDNCALVICGADKLTAKANTLITCLKAENRISIVGTLHDVRPLLWASDVFALPSLYDPGSNAILEALSSGLPVITTKDVGMAPEIANAGAGILCEREVDSIVQALIQIQSRKESNSAQPNPRGFAVNYDQDLIVNHWLTLYERFRRRKC